ncbi:MAG: DUF4838 domain-containing protein [Verrucomicrobia bacterium]|nr:DUF4838 domain-containing protein [Verrucomicrobiota bacterium]
MIRPTCLVLLSFAALLLTGCRQPKAPEPVAVPISIPQTIVTSDKPVPEEKLAASQLAETLQKITGRGYGIAKESEFPSATLPAIYLGKTKFAAANAPGKLAPEEWLVKTSGENLIITGGLPRGLLYATWEFLEKLGCAWVARDAERIPKIANPTFAGELRGKPFIRIRELYTAFSGYGWYSPKQMLAEQWFRLHNKSGAYGNIEGVATHDSMLPPQNSHTADVFYCSYKEYFPTHPEYFAMGKDGKRFDGTLTGPAAGQLCYTSEGAREVVTAKLKSLIREDNAQKDAAGLPRTWLYDISQADNFDWCQCPQCQELIKKEGANSATLLTFINQIAEDIEKEFPDVYITTFAYMPTTKPPATIRPRRNVIIRWIDWGGFALAPDPSIPLRTQKERADNLLAWGKLSPGLALWDYGLGGNSPASVPFNPVPVLADDYRLFAEAGVIAAAVQESEDLDTWWCESNFKPLYNYMVLRLMANPTLNVSDEVQTFMEVYYGPAAKPMRALYDFLEHEQEQLPSRDKHNGNVSQIPYITVPFFQRILAELDAAAAACAGPENKAYLQRVRREIAHTDFMLLADWDTLEKKSGPLPFDRAKLVESIKVAAADVMTGYSDTIRPIMEKKLADALKPPPPLPAEFSAVPRSEVLDLYSDAVYAQVDDPESLTGRTKKLTFPLNAALGPPTFGTYDPASKTYGPGLSIKNVPQDGQYHFHKIGRWTLNSFKSYIYSIGAAGDWNVGPVELGPYFDQPAGPAYNTYDIYVSAKFTGPAYIKGSKDTENGFWVDRVLLIRANDSQ